MCPPIWPWQSSDSPHPPIYLFFTELSSSRASRCYKTRTKMLGLLEPVKEDYPHVSYADLIVLAGNVALRRGASIPTLSYCKGRVDAEADDPNHAFLSILEPIREYETVIIGVRDRTKIAGLTVPQMVALAGRPRSTTYITGLGFTGSYAEDAGDVYFS